MAEIITGAGQKKTVRGVKKMEKHSTRVDLTPMVDLGFLLITFFIFTTTLSQAHALKLIMPDDTGQATPIKESGAITLLLAGNDLVEYYEGKPDVTGNNFRHITVEELRQVLIDKKRRTVERDLMVVIKPSKNAVYKNVIDVLDEMTINGIKKYALADITVAEENILEQNW